MFRLGEHVGRNIGGLGRVVSDNKNLARSGDHIDINPSEDEPFGCRDINIAWPNDFIDAGNGLCTIRQSGHRLRPSDPEKGVGSGNMSCGEQGWIVPFRRRWRDEDDLFDPSHFSRNHIHEHRRWIGRGATGNIHADPFKRRYFLAQGDPQIVPVGPG